MAWHVGYCGSGDDKVERERERERERGNGEEREIEILKYSDRIHILCDSSVLSHRFNLMA